MAFNFCSSDFKPRIHCDKVTMDGYGVENLISGNRGFMVERFIKPPVTVTVQFPVAIDIARIIVDGSVGAQKSARFEILSKQHRTEPKSSWLMPEARTQAKNIPASTEGVFLPIGRASLNSPQIVVFTNGSYATRSFSERNDLLSLPPGDMSACFTLQHRQRQQLCSVSHVAIRITQTFSACVVALKSVQVWGQPSARCPKHLLRIFQQSLYQRGDHNSVVNCNPTPQCTVGNPISGIKQTHGGNTNPIGSKVEIPEEFLDTLTFELMTLPMLLPSGHTVDQSTLERHAAAEEIWGRPSSDPFTGMPFTQQSKPLLNSHLKARIDQFMLHHPSDDHVLRAGRTVGRFTDLHNSHMVSCSGPAQKPMCPYATMTSMNLPDAAGIKQQFGEETNRYSGQSKRCFTSQKCDESKQIPTKRIKLETGNSQLVTTHKTSGSENNTISHHDKLSQSLDLALSSTLRSLPSFRSKNMSMGYSLVNDVHSKNNFCLVCKCSVDGSGVYQLPCLHRSCRECLSKLRNDNQTYHCSQCSRNFTSADISKVNL